MSLFVTFSRNVLPVAKRSSLMQFVQFSSKPPTEAFASAAAVKNLRELSGAPLMDCKKALLDATVQGDIQKALDWLRTKGIAKATSGNRETKEGLIGVYQANNKVSLVEINCETDFVALNKDFQHFVALVCQTMNENASQSGAVAAQDILNLKPSNNNNNNSKKEYSSLQEKLGDIISSIRENIVVKRGKNISVSNNNNNNSVVSTYVHGIVGGDDLPPQVKVRI
jgi:elongation factor Ts